MNKKIKLTPGIKATLSRRGISSSTGKGLSVNDKSKETSVNSSTSGAGISRRIKLSHSRPVTGKKALSPIDPKIMRTIILAVIAVVLILIFFMAVSTY